jgi:hypothetical protein
VRSGSSGTSDFSVSAGGSTSERTGEFLAAVVRGQSCVRKAVSWVRASNFCMRWGYLLIALVLTSRPLAAQQTAVSSPGQTPPSSPSATSSPAHDDTDLPVSLDRIREGLAKPPSQFSRALDKVPDFRTEVRIQQKLQELLSKLDFRGGPTPAGGIYSYEQQRNLWNSVDHPIMQPYAAFSGSELITIAVENLLGHYVGAPALNGLKSAEREREEAAARAEVDRAIADYCASSAERASLDLCTERRDKR